MKPFSLRIFVADGDPGGVHAFEQVASLGAAVAQVVLSCRCKGVAASGYEATQGFVVKAGSQAVVETTPSTQQHVRSMFDHFRRTLEKLGAEKGMLGLIFAKAQNKFQDPAKLRRLVVDLIDAESWSAMGGEVKGDAYEGLLEKNAQDTKSGTGPFFTLKTSSLKREDLDDFAACYNPANRNQRKATWSPENPHGRWRCYDYAELVAREIVDDLEVALEPFRLIAGDLEVDADAGALV